MITYYFPIDRVPVEDISEINIQFDNKKDFCIPILLNDECNKCGKKISVNMDRVGNSTQETYLFTNCSHMNYYDLIWEARIKKSITQIDSINDGCKCEKCTAWVPMAAPNLPNNKFKCYSCRTHPLAF